MPRHWAPMGIGARLLVLELLKHWPGRWADRSEPNAVHEARLLNLAIDKAHQLLGWQPVWNFEQTIAMTVNWYRDHKDRPAEARALTMRQIGDYVTAAKAAKITWAADAASA